MKLTIEQIALIEQTLVLNNLLFDDIKLEVTDHIASEIEALMNDNTLSFEENFKTVFEKWKPQLKPSFSGLIGITTPKLINDKYHKLLQKQLMISGIISFLIVISLIGLERILNNIGVILNFQNVLKLICLIEFSLMCLACFLIWKSNYQTMYSYLMKKNSFSFLFFLFFIAIGIFPLKWNNDNLETAFITHFTPIAYLLMGIFYLKLAYKHLQFDKKLSISNS